MADAGSNISNFGGLFIKYLPGFVNMLSRASRFREIPLGKMKWQGEKLLKKLNVKWNTSIHNTVDGGAIKPAGAVQFVDIVGSRKFVTASAAITDGLLATAGSTENSAVAASDFILRNTLEMAKRYENFFMSRNGTGVVATLGATTTGTAITVSDGRGFHPGADYEIRAATAHNGYAIGDVIASFTVSNVQRSLTAAGEATVNLTATLANANQIAGDYISWGVGDYSSYGRAITGLDALIDDGLVASFQGVNTITYPYYTSPVVDGGGTSFTVTAAILRQLQAMQKQESPEFDVPGGALIYTSVWDGIQIETIYENLLRLTPDSSKVGLKGGMTFQSALGEYTIATDHDMPYGKMFLIDRSRVSRPVQKEMDWRRSEGGGIFERSDRFLGYTATLVEIADLFIEERHTCAKMENMRVTPGSAY